MACAFALLFLEPFSSMFWGIIPICGLSEHIRRVPRAKMERASSLERRGQRGGFRPDRRAAHALIPTVGWPNWSFSGLPMSR
jgi:hypothetical protein